MREAFHFINEAQVRRIRKILEEERNTVDLRRASMPPAVDVR